MAHSCAASPPYTVPLRKKAPELQRPHKCRVGQNCIYTLHMTVCMVIFPAKNTVYTPYILINVRFWPALHKCNAPYSDHNNALPALTKMVFSLSTPICLSMRWHFSMSSCRDEAVTPTLEARGSMSQ